jgi:hypothetical protein
MGKQAQQAQQAQQAAPLRVVSYPPSHLNTGEGRGAFPASDKTISYKIYQPKTQNPPKQNPFQAAIEVKITQEF